jgi:AraC-like DNA-binding protein
MGYDEPSVFHRSFKKWTSMTPGEYRQQLNQHDAEEQAVA